MLSSNTNTKENNFSSEYLATDYGMRRGGGGCGGAALKDNKKENNFSNAYNTNTKENNLCNAYASTGRPEIDALSSLTSSRPPSAIASTAGGGAKSSGRACTPTKQLAKHLESMQVCVCVCVCV